MNTISSDNPFIINVLGVNGEDSKNLLHKAIEVQYICKGGFRFMSDEMFEIEDRVRVRLTFPDHHSQEVYGRICYYDNIGDNRFVYGFSVLDGFYSLPELHTQ